MTINIVLLIFYYILYIFYSITNWTIFLFTHLLIFLQLDDDFILFFNLLDTNHNLDDDRSQRS